MMCTRTEYDLLGEKEIPADVTWGIHTERALENFPMSGSRVAPSLIAALAEVKKACALANKELGLIDAAKADAIIHACEQIERHPECPLPALQGGAGTSSNMFINEVIANQAGHTIHPIEDVNLNQSTNDVFPTAVKVAAIYGLRSLSAKVEKLQGSFQRLEIRFAHILTLGKTELVDAVPITLGAEFGAFAEAFARDRWRTFKGEERLRVVNLGGTAVGTGLTAPRSYIFLVTDKLREITGLGLSRAENMVDQTANADAFVEVSGLLKTSASNLLKICGDLRLLHMNKKIKLPAVQAGSSIMPGKVNPVILESVMQIGIKVQANDFIITECASRGSLQMNEFMPLLASALLESMELLGSASEMLARHAEQIEANEAECKKQFFQSVEIITAFLPSIGYERATELVEVFKATERMDFKEYLMEELGAERVEKTLTPQNLMAMGHR
ncbi:MAG: lyase family protein [Pontiella sp.]